MTHVADAAEARPGLTQHSASLSKRQLGRETVHGAIGMLSLRIAQVGLEFSCGLLLARLLGATGYGVYAVVIGWVGLLGIPAAVGLDRLVVREIARFRVAAEWSLLRGILRRGNQIVILSSIATALAGLICVRALGADLHSDMALALQLGMAVVPLVAVARVRQAALQGLGRVAWGQVPEALVQPLSLLALTCAAFLVPATARNGTSTVMLHIAAAALGCAVGIVLLRHSTPIEVNRAEPEFRTRAWLSGAMLFLWIIGMNVVVSYCDVVMLGLIAGPQPAGVYRVASQMAAFVALPLTAVSMAFAPTIAGLYASGDIITLQRKATAWAFAILGCALPVAAVLLLFGLSLLRLFGPEFEVGYAALAILTAGYLLNAAMGTSGYLLIMTRHERAAAVTFTCGAAINLLGNAVLIPFWGVNGAAAATSMSIVFVSVVFAALVHRRLGVQPIAFLRPGKSHRPPIAGSTIRDITHD